MNINPRLHAESSSPAKDWVGSCGGYMRRMLEVSDGKVAEMLEML